MIGKRRCENEGSETSVITPAQCRAARALLKLSLLKLADAADLAPSVIDDFELERAGVPSAAIAALLDTLIAAGIEFIPDGVRLRRSAPESIPVENLNASNDE